LNDLVAEMDIEMEDSESLLRAKKVEPNVNITMQVNLKSAEMNAKGFVAGEKGKES